MNISALVADIDRQLAKLQAARAALLAYAGTERKPGRPKENGAIVLAPKFSSTSKVAAKKGAKSTQAKTGMSPEGRARIAAAVKARWAKVKAEKKKAGAGAKRASTP